LKFDGFDFLLHSTTLSVFNLKRDGRIKNLLFFSLKGDINNLLSTRGKFTFTAINYELLRKFINTRKLPVGWNRGTILES
jgi:hypothetical protein